MSNSATDDDDVLFPKMFEIFNTNWMHILICICGGTCCFLPLILGTKSFLEDSTLRYSLTSEGYFKDSSVASIALAFPIIVDLIFDNLISLNKWMNGKPTQQKPHLNTAEKLVLLLGINAVPFVSLLPTDTPDLALIYGCCHKFRIVIVSGIMIIALCRYDKKFWCMSATIAFLLCSTFAEVTSLFIGNMVAKDSHDPLFRNMEYAIIIFIWSPVILFCASNLRWLFVIPYDRMISGKKGPNLLRRNDSGLYFATIWVLMSLAGAVVLSAVMGTYHSIRFFDTSALMITNYLFLSLELVITVFAMHSFKYENMGGLNALIDSKNSYVRYISHELRTPLNTAFLGLKFLSDDLKTSCNPLDAMRCETLEDVNLSCKAALDILNDLLCFDKLESGILVLHKQDMPILPFISNCVNMFQVQAREIGVTMKIINTTCMDQGPGPMSMQFNKCYPITDTETIYIDKFKMDQVIRNILSNALKFTPRNGTVSVSVMYDPQNFLQNKDAYKSPLRKAKSQIFRDINTFFGCVLPFSSPPPSNQIYALDDALENGKSRSFDETSDCGHLVISVIDSGAGISEENQKRLFHNIVQFNPEILQSGGGSGLGLWITKGIVDLHSGHIDVHSDGEGLGSVFTIRIPMWRHRTNSVESFSGSDVCDDALSLPAEEKDRNISRCGSSHNLSIMSKPSSKYPSFDLFPPNIPMTDYIPPSPERFSPVKDATFHPTHWSPRSSIIAPAPVLGPGTKFEILVVDDSRLNRKMLCKMLTSAGYCCDEAEDGLMAISKVRDRLDIAGCGNGSGGGILTGTDLRSYDAILMDFVMPNLDGPGATKIIRAMGYNGPIYGVTGNALEGDIQYFLDCGAVRIFTKPLDFPLLQECLTHALTPSHMRIANASCDENFI